MKRSDLLATVAVAIATASPITGWDVLSALNSSSRFPPFPKFKLNDGA
jgi:hypothetical protein